MACKTNPIKRETQEKVVWKHIEINAVYNDVLGGTLAGGYSIKNSIKDLHRRESDLRDNLALARATKKLSEVSDVGKELKEIKLTIKDLSFLLKDLPAKSKALKKIESLFVEHVVQLQSQMLYTANPRVIFEMLKEYVTMSYKNFNTFADLDSVTLGSMYHKLNRFFTKIRKHSATKEGVLSHTQNQILDPSTVAFHTDPTGLGHKVISQLKELDDNVYSDGRVYKEAIDKSYDQMVQLIEERDFMFNHIPANSKKLTDYDREKAAMNVVEFVQEVLDGQLVHASPTPIIVKNKAGKLTFSGEFAEDRQEYYQILNNNIFNGINDGGQIQKMNIKGRDYYYILIKKVDAKGKEYHRLYEAPYNEEFNSLEGSPTGKQASLEFYKEWNLRGENSLAGDFYYDENGKAVRREGALTSGWLKATRYKPLEGTISKGKKKGQKFKTSSYLGYEQLSYPDIPNEVWNMIRVIRDNLKLLRSHAIKEIAQNEANLYNVLKELAPDLKDADRNALNQIINDRFGVDIDTLDMNMVVRGDHVYTTNHFYGELKNYVPWKFRLEDVLLGYVKARESMDRQITNNAQKLDALKESARKGNVSVKQEITQLRNELKEDAIVLTHYSEAINVFLGLEEAGRPLNQSTLIKASKHRSGIMHPLPIVSSIEVNGKKTSRVTHSGRRKDYAIFHETINETLRSIHQNKIKTSFLDMLGKTSVPTTNYVADHMKSTFGRKDVEAGFFGIDYSDKRLAKMLSKIKGRNVSPDEVYRDAKIWSQAISANLLSGIFTSVSNNVQRTNTMVKTEFTFAFKAWALRRNDPDRVKAIGDNAGVTDTVIAIGDVLLGTSTASTEWYTGLKEKSTAFMLWLSKHDFMTAARKHPVWKAVAEKLATNADPVELTLYEARELALEGIWEISNGLGQGTLTKAQLKRLPKKFNAILVEHSVGRLVDWALKGGILGQLGKGLSFFKFSPSEINMRQEVAVVAGYQAQADGLIPADYEGDEIFNHPEAKRYARILVNQTMFGMTNAHLPKMMKGSIGTLFFKFKPYQMKQFMTEWQEMSNWVHSLMDKGVPNSEILRDFIALKPKYHTNKTFRKLLLLRGVWTAISNLLFYAPIFSMFNNFVGRRMGYKTRNAMERGTESQIMSAIMKVLLNGAALAGMFADDEEERVYQESFRFFMPMYMNVLYDTIKEGDPFRIMQLYSKTGYEALTTAKDWITD